MCKDLQHFTHNSMGRCFGMWARLVTKYNRIIGVVCLLIYILIAANNRNFQEFPSTEV